MRRARNSLLINDVADRVWEQEAQYAAAPNETSASFARLIEYFGKTTSLTDIDNYAAKTRLASRSPCQGAARMRD